MSGHIKVPYAVSVAMKNNQDDIDRLAALLRRPSFTEFYHMIRDLSNHHIGESEGLWLKRLGEFCKQHSWTYNEYLVKFDSLSDAELWRLINDDRR
jgi:hypothetical protein